MLTFVQKDPTGRVVRTAVVMERKNNNSRFNRLPLDDGRLNPPPVMTREKHFSAKGGCSLEYYTQKKNQNHTNQTSTGVSMGGNYFFFWKFGSSLIQSVADAGRIARK